MAMPVAKVTDAEKIGRYAADQLKERPEVTGIWTDQCGEISKIWILVDTDDLEKERSVRRILWDLMDQYPGSYVDLQVTNLHAVDENVRRYVIPEKAKRVAL